MESYHDKKFKKCKYCDKEAKRNITKNGRNKGHYRTCGEKSCVKFNYIDPKIRITKSHKGENHPNWIEDRSKLKYKRSRYEIVQWRKAVYKRDNYTCQECGKVGHKLNAHHIKPYAVFPELREDVNNGITLCVECHKKTEHYSDPYILKRYAIS